MCIKKNIIKFILVTFIIFLTGCNTSELEKKNNKLQKSITIMENNNSKLKSEIMILTIENKKLIDELQSLKNELKQFANENNELNVSLAKSELYFSQKYRIELEDERKKLDEKKASFREEIEKVKNESYKNAKEVVYTIYLLPLVLLLILALFFLYRSNKINKKIKKDDEAERIKRKKEIDDYRIEINKISHAHDELDRKLKEGTKNHIVSKINQYTEKRDDLIKRIESIEE